MPPDARYAACKVSDELASNNPSYLHKSASTAGNGRVALLMHCVTCFNIMNVLSNVVWQFGEHKHLKMKKTPKYNKYKQKTTSQSTGVK
jgi:hypothetical protein